MSEIMRYTILSTLFLMGLLTTHAQDAPLPALEEQRLPSPPADTRLARIQTYLNDIETMTATFVQRAPDGSVTRGTLALERPGRMRFDYGEDLPILLVSDGTTLTLVDYEDKDVLRWPVADTPFGFLVSQQLDFQNGPLIVETMPGPLPHLTVIRVVNPDYEEFGSLEMTFAEDGENGITLLGWEAIDIQGYVTRIALDDLTFGTRFSKKVWEFEDPRRLPAQRRRRGR